MKKNLDQFRVMALESLKGSFFDFQTNEPSSLAESLDSQMDSILEKSGPLALANFVGGIKEYYDSTASEDVRFTWFIRGFRKIAFQNKNTVEITKDIKEWVDFGFSYQSQTALKIALGEHLYSAAHLISCWEGRPLIEIEDVVLNATKLSPRQYHQPDAVMNHFQNSFTNWYDNNFPQLRKDIEGTSYLNYAVFCSRIISASDRCPVEKSKNSLINDFFVDMLKSIKTNQELEDDNAYVCVKRLLFEMTFYSSKSLSPALSALKKDKEFSPWLKRLSKEKFNLSGPCDSLCGSVLTSSYNKKYFYVNQKVSPVGWSRWCFTHGKFEDATLWESIGAPKITTNQLLKIMKHAQSINKEGLHPDDLTKVQKDLAYLEKVALSRNHENIIPKAKPKSLNAL